MGKSIAVKERAKKVFERVISCFSRGELRIKNGYLQTPVVKYEHKRTGKKIVYFGMMHVGQGEYYKQINKQVKELENQDYKVLFEQVRRMGEDKFDNLSEDEQKFFKMFKIFADSLTNNMKMVASCLGLELQKDNLKPDESSWINVDTSDDEFVREMLRVFPRNRVKKILGKITPKADDKGIPAEGEATEIVMKKFEHYVGILAKIDNRMGCTRLLRLIGKEDIKLKLRAKLNEKLTELTKDIEIELARFRKQDKERLENMKIENYVKDKDNVKHMQWFIDKMFMLMPLTMRLSGLFSRELLLVILDYRNKIAIENSLEYIPTCNACYLWGSGHIPGMSKYLCQMGYVQKEVDWLNVCKINYYPLSYIKNKKK